MTKILTRVDIPCWYDLRVDYNDPPAPTLIISIHEAVVANWKKIDPNTAIVIQYRSFIKPGSTFYGGLDKDFGFNGFLKRKNDAVGNFVDFSFEIPQVFKLSDKRCSMCKGTKKRDGGECLYCSGSGKVLLDCSTDAYTKAASLSILLSGLYFPPDIDTPCKYRQLFAIQSLAAPEMHGASINGMLAPVLVKSLKAKLSKRLPEVEKEMKSAYLHAVGGWGSRHLSGSDFRATINQGNLHLNCPGNATGIDPAMSLGRNGEGYEFYSHNVYSLPQQFSLLAGLGRLNVDSSSIR